jgi:hypothetical protein
MCNVIKLGSATLLRQTESASAVLMASRTSNIANYVAEYDASGLRLPPFGSLREAFYHQLVH